jgi:hypothetical protein
MESASLEARVTELEERLETLTQLVHSTSSLLSMVVHALSANQPLTPEQITNLDYEMTKLRRATGRE